MPAIWSQPQRVNLAAVHTQRLIPADIPSIVRNPSTLDLWIKREFVFIFDICEYDVTCYLKKYVALKLKFVEFFIQ